MQFAVGDNLFQTQNAYQRFNAIGLSVYVKLEQILVLLEKL